MTKTFVKIAFVLAGLSAVASADVPLPKCLPCSSGGKVIANAVPAPQVR